MKFGTHILPTYMAETDGRLADFYRRMFEQIIEVEKLGFDQAWVTEHHFGGMPQEMALKNIRLFAERVMPALRHL